MATYSKEDAHEHSPCVLSFIAQRQNRYNESTVGADTSVDMSKLLVIANTHMIS